MYVFRIFAGFTLAACLLSAAEEGKARWSQGQAVHPTVGSWIGKAVQVCNEPVTPCAKGAIFMTPSVNADGVFIANDTLEMIPPPWGTHTTAHGSWEPTGPKSMVADYLFINPPSNLTLTPNANVSRLRWSSETIEDDNTMVGYVNLYLTPWIPTVWESLSADQFPTIPKEGVAAANVPQKTIYKHPSECTAQPASSCPAAVFKFKILRIMTQ